MKSNIISYYKLFTSAKLESLRDFLMSPFYNKNDKHLSLYQLFKSKTFIELEKGAVFERVYGKGRLLNEQVLKNLLNEHGQLIRTFLSVIDNRRQPAVFIRSLKNEYAPSSLIYRNIKKIKKQAIHQTDSYLQLFHIADLQLEYLFEEQKISIESIEQTFQEKISYFNTFKLSQQLKLICDYYNLNATLNLDFEISELRACLKIKLCF